MPFKPEFAHPYYVFEKAGYELTVASPAGGAAPLDPKSVELFKEDAESTAFLRDHKPLWEKTVRLADVDPSQFDALFYPGGHGPMYDLVDDPTSQALAAEFAAAGKPVAAVCHGPAALLNVRVKGDSSKYLLGGKKVTGFSNTEEEAVQLTKVVPFLLETRLNEVSGGGYVKAAQDWGEKVVDDGNIITGQNPASSKAVGEAIVKALEK